MSGCPSRRAYLLALAFFAIATVVVGADFVEARVKSAARVFRPVLGADLDLEKKVGDDGGLRIVVVHAGQPELAELAAAQLAGEALAGHRLDVVVATPEELDRHAAAAVFLGEKLDDDTLARVLRHASGRHILAFSPFEADVERGVPAGIVIGASVKPYLGRRALEAAGLRMNPRVFEYSVVLTP